MHQDNLDSLLNVLLEEFSRVTKEASSDNGVIFDYNRLNDLFFSAQSKLKSFISLVEKLRSERDSLFLEKRELCVNKTLTDSANAELSKKVAGLNQILDQKNDEIFRLKEAIESRETKIADYEKQQNFSTDFSSVKAIIDKLEAAKSAAMLERSSFGFPNDSIEIKSVHYSHRFKVGDVMHPDVYIKAITGLHHASWIVCPIDSAISMLIVHAEKIKKVEKLSALIFRFENELRAAGVLNTSDEHNYG